MPNQVLSGPYAEKLRQVVQTIRDSGAICLFANSTGTVADNTIPNSPNYLTNCKAFNAAAEEVMREMNVPVTDIYGLIPPRIKDLMSSDLIHTNAEADQMMAELIANVSFGAPKPATHRRPKPATVWGVLDGRILLFGPVGKWHDQVVAV